TKHANDLAAELNERDRKRIIDDNKAQIYALTAEDVAAWREAMQPVWQKFEKDIGPDLIKEAVSFNK
ncbi:C4-dicarboxylate ABC transporter, partial [Photobacterium phosphoreum]|nr:C4-dicarboxylate ABC transporter [Photobacterium phosphoreum]